MKLIVIDSERCVGCQSCMFACARRHHEAGLAKSCIGVHSSGGMERGFNLKVCRACEDPPCLKMCPTGCFAPRQTRGRAPGFGKVSWLRQLPQRLPVESHFLEQRDQQAHDLQPLRLLRQVLPPWGYRRV
jgi:ferredoxin-like protein FixX